MTLTTPADFPSAQWIAVETRISGHLMSRKVDAATVPGFFEYAGGWNGFRMRFRAADEYCEAAARLLASLPGSPPEEDRYEQERNVFGFFAHALATIESCCFATYHIGRIVEPQAFQLAPERVNVLRTAEEVAKEFSGSMLDARLAALVADSDYEDLGNIRNVLLHREVPGRWVEMGGGFAKWRDHGRVLEPALVTLPRAWLGRTIGPLVDAVSDLVHTRL